MPKYSVAVHLPTVGLTTSDEMLEQETHDDVATFATVLGYRIIDGRRDEHFQHAHGDCDGGWAVYYAAQVSETTPQPDQMKITNV